MRLWNPEDGEVVRILAEGVDNMRALAFSPDGKLIATNVRDRLGWGHKILLCDTQSGKVVGELSNKGLAATMLTFSPDGKLLVCAGARKIYIWNVAERKLLPKATAATAPTPCTWPCRPWPTSVGRTVSTLGARKWMQMSQFCRTSESGTKWSMHWAQFAICILQFSIFNLPPS